MPTLFTRGVLSAEDETRQARIDMLIAELAANRRARRHGDVELRRRIEAELVVLLEAQVRSRAPTSAVGGATESSATGEAPESLSG
jgi:hypothetical protein